MNVFLLRRGQGGTTVNDQIVRLAPPLATVCVLEIMGDPVEEALAEQVAVTLSAARKSEVVSRIVQGYQIGSIQSNLQRKYKLYFMG